MDNEPAVILDSFAGCVEALIGVELEDCYLEIHTLSPAVLDWLNDTVDGKSTARRDMIVIQTNASGVPVSRLSIGQAFLRERVGPRCLRQ